MSYDPLLLSFLERVERFMKQGKLVITVMYEPGVLTNAEETALKMFIEQSYKISFQRMRLDSLKGTGDN